jgi:DNA polymerase III epsilon subunit family exonuclease
VETTGLLPENCRLTEVAGIAFDMQGKVLARFEELCDPGMPVPDEVTAITGITDEMVKGAAAPLEVVKRFLSFAGDAVLVAHNALFDGSFVAAELERAKLPIPNLQVIDTLNWARSRVSLRDFRLATVAKHFRIKQRGQHRAALDADTVVGIFRALAKRAKAKTVESVMGVAGPFPLSDCAAGTLRLPAALDALPLYIDKGQKLSMIYLGGSHGDGPRPITPKGLVRVGQFNYLVAFCHQDQREKQFRLDRIREVQPLPDPKPKSKSRSKSRSKPKPNSRQKLQPRKRRQAASAP